MFDNLHMELTYKYTIEVRQLKQWNKNYKANDPIFGTMELGNGDSDPLWWELDPQEDRYTDFMQQYEDNWATAVANFAIEYFGVDGTVQGWYFGTFQDIDEDHPTYIVMNNEDWMWGYAGYQLEGFVEVHVTQEGV